MEWDLRGRNSRRIKEGFQKAKKEVLELHDKLACFEEEIKRLQEQVIKLQENQRKFEEERISSDSQSSPSVPELGLLIEEIVGKALENHFTKAGDEILSGTDTFEEPQPTPKQEPLEPPRDKLKEDLLRTYQRNRKNIIKQQILGELRKGGYTKLELRDIVVDQKKYCSRSAFYRYLDELEMERLVDLERKKGRDLIILTNQQ